MTNPKLLLEPSNTVELLRGWLLHAHKGRDRHDLAARRYEGRRSIFGVPTIALSTIVGTAVFTSLDKQAATWAWVHVLVGLCSVAAAVLSSLQTFFEYPERAERHRKAGVSYKAIIRELEEALAPDSSMMRDTAWLDKVRERLDALEEGAPVVPPGIYDEVEAQYKNVTLVPKASDLYKRSP
jgi:Protein of unknown function (DUF4231)